MVELLILLLKGSMGKQLLKIDGENLLFEGVSSESQVWMSHGDSLTKIPNGFSKYGYSENSPFCAISNPERNIYGIQFHPEVHHSTEGKRILENFARKICDCKASWTMGSFIEQQKKYIKEIVGDDGVLCALSGGVDSTVTAVLIHEAIGDQLHCIHVDSGLMRSGESEQIDKLFKEHFSMKIDVVNAEESFSWEVKWSN